MSAKELSRGFFAAAVGWPLGAWMFTMHGWGFVWAVSAGALVVSITAEFADRDEGPFNGR